MEKGMKPLQCTHCDKIFQNQRLLNNHYNQLGIEYIESKGFFEQDRKNMIKQKEDHDKRKEKEGDSDLIFNEKDNKKNKD